ncbi:MAG: PAS domain S-box protein [Saprospiraceae bacterium]
MKELSIVKTISTYSPVIFSTLFQNMFDSVLIYNYESETIKECNQSILKLLGYSKNELLDLNRFDLMPQFSSLYPNVDIHKLIGQDHQEKVMNGEVIYSTGEFIRKNGATVFAQVNIVPTGEERGDAFVILHEITQELENTKILQQSKKKYETIFNNACESIIYFDLIENKLVECNMVAVEMFRVANKSEFLQSDWKRYYAPSDGTLNQLDTTNFFKEIIREAKKVGSYCCVFLAQRFDGSTFVAELTTVFVYKKSESKVVFFLKDITEEYYNKLEWKKLYHEQEQILDSMPLQFGQKDLENNFVKCNQAMTRALDSTAENIIGKNLAEFIPEESARKSHLEDLQIARTKQPILGITFSVKNKEGKTTWSKIDKLPLLNKKNDVRGILTHVTDITDLMESQQKIIESERNNNALFNNAFDGIMTFDCNENKILRCNLRLANYLSTDTRTIVASSIEEFSPEYQPNGMDSCQAFIQVVKKTKKRGTYETEWIFSAKNGEELVCEMIAFLLPQGTSCQIMFVIKDITDRKDQDKIIKENVVTLNLKNAELTKYIESNVQLENFASIASHDMQAPLRTIQSYTQLLQKSLKENATPAQKEYMHFITSSTSNMRHLIRDLRAFSKVDSAKLNIRSVNIDFMLIEVMKELKATIDYQSAKVIIVNELPVLDGDRIKLKQLFQNLITNALKYVEKGVIPRVEISSEERDADFLFKVKDNGIGIAEQDQKRIFQLFERLHEMSQYVGTGIGLSLCKKVVEQHFGKIGVESNEGEGSTFYFSISKEVNKKVQEII